MLTVQQSRSPAQSACPVAAHQPSTTSRLRSRPTMPDRAQGVRDRERNLPPARPRRRHRRPWPAHQLRRRPRRRAGRLRRQAEPATPHQPAAPRSRLGHLLLPGHPGKRRLAAGRSPPAPTGAGHGPGRGHARVARPGHAPDVPVAAYRHRRGPARLVGGATRGLCDHRPGPVPARLRAPVAPRPKPVPAAAKPPPPPPPPRGFPARRSPEGAFPMPTPDPPAGPHPTADPSAQQSDSPIPGWQWASLVAVLLGGQAVLLVLTTWTLATSASHGWATPIVLALGLLARLVPDTLKLTAWAATAQTWTPPVDRHIHLGITIAALVLANLAAIAT